MSTIRSTAGEREGAEETQSVGNGEQFGNVWATGLSFLA